MNYDALFDIFTSSSSTATAITTETNFAKHVAARRGAAHGGGLSNGELWLKCQHIDRKLGYILSSLSASRTSGTSKTRDWRGLNGTYLEIM